ncbi:GNAT family N-acetyltransferase [Methylorubrum sp. POS3]|uniref:GNAT family N-acetyltransferase n=1 Tax=Methylorubrum sp. POS3 TaxID=2998492 RepID=UPI00372CE580
MSDCHFHPYDPADLPAVADIFVRAIRETASADYDPAQIAAWSRFDPAAWIRQRAARTTWVARIEAVPAGFADLEPDGHLDHLYVHPGFVRRGVGRCLISALEAHAVTSGLSALYTEASLTARPFFEAVGFRILAEETVARSGQHFRRYRMRKDGLRPRPAPDR